MTILQNPLRNVKLSQKSLFALVELKSHHGLAPTAENQLPFHQKIIFFDAVKNVVKDIDSAFKTSKIIA